MTVFSSYVMYRFNIRDYKNRAGVTLYSECCDVVTYLSINNHPFSRLRFSTRDFMPVFHSFSAERTKLTKSLTRPILFAYLSIFLLKEESFKLILKLNNN